MINSFLTLLSVLLMFLMMSCSHLKMQSNARYGETYYLETNFYKLRKIYFEPLKKLKSKPVSYNELISGLQIISSLSKSENLYQNDVLKIPAKSKIDIPYNSFCLDLYKVEPFGQNDYSLEKIERSEFPLLKDLIEIAEKKPWLRLDIQEIIWNIANLTPINKYPKRLEKILFDANKNSDKIISDYIKNEKRNKLTLRVLNQFLGLFEKYFNQDYIDLDTAQRAIYSAESSYKNIRDLKNKYFSNVEGILVSATVKNMNEGVLHFENPMGKDQKIDLSKVYLKSKNQDVQSIAIYTNLKAFDNFLAEELIKISESFYGAEISEDEKKLIRQNPREALQVYYFANIAYFWTDVHFGKTKSDDEADAYRHFTWSALICNSLGPQKAMKYTEAHEGDNGHDKSSEMDRYNNNIGIDFVKNIKEGVLTNEKIEREGISRLLSGELRVLNPGTSIHE